METDRKYISLKAPGMERYIRLRSLGKKLFRRGNTWADTTAKGETSLSKRQYRFIPKKETDRDSGTVLFLFISNGGYCQKDRKGVHTLSERISGNWIRGLNRLSF